MKNLGSVFWSEEGNTVTRICIQAHHQLNDRTVTCSMSLACAKYSTSRWNHAEAICIYSCRSFGLVLAGPCDTRV